MNKFFRVFLILIAVSGLFVTLGAPALVGGPVVPKAFVGLQLVSAGEVRSQTIAGVLVKLEAITAHTTAASFTTAEAALWKLVSQEESATVFPASIRIPKGFKIVEAGAYYERITAGISGVSFVVDSSNWRALGASGTVDSIQNVTATGSALAFSSTVIANCSIACTITLPNATAGEVGKPITIKSIGPGVVTFAPFAANVLNNMAALSQGNGVIAKATAVGVVDAVAGLTTAAVNPTTLAPWAASSVVVVAEQKSVTIIGTLTGVRSNSGRTTGGASFDLTEAANWTYLSQSNVPAWTASSLVLTGFQIVDGGITYQSNATRTTGAVSFAADSSFWTALSPSGAPGNIVNFSESDTDDNPNTGVITFTPSTPALVGALYVKTNGIAPSIWRWTGSAYVRAAPRALEADQFFGDRLVSATIPGTLTALASRITFSQITPNITITLANPANPSLIQRITVTNVGITPLTVQASELKPDEVLDFEWNVNSGLWGLVGKVGSSGLTYVAVSSTNQARVWNESVAVTTGASLINVPLATAVGNAAKEELVCKSDAGSGIVTVAPFAGQTINGSATPYTLSSQYQCAWFISDGSNVTVSNTSNGVLGENGQAFNTTGIATIAANSVIVSFTLNSVGKFDVTGQIGANFASTGSGRLYFRTAAGVEVPYSRAYFQNGSAGSFAAPIQVRAQIDNTVAGTTYQLFSDTSWSAFYGYDSPTPSQGGTKVMWNKISGFQNVIGQTVDRVRARMNPLTASAVTGSNSVNGYTGEHMLWNEYTFNGSSSKIQISLIDGSITVKAGVTAEIAVNLNRLYNGGPYSPQIKDVTAGGAGIVLTGTTDNFLGTGGDAAVSAHRRNILRYTVAPTVDSKYVVELTGGWNSIPAYWSASLFPSAPSAVVADWNNIEVTQVGTSSATTVTPNQTFTVSGVYPTSTTPQVIGTLGGVTFTITPSSDPVTFAVSSAATGQIISRVYGPSSTAGATIDAWTTGASAGGAGSILTRARQWNGATSSTFGLNNASYFMDVSGNLTANGRMYEIRGSSANGTLHISVTMLN
jgi:hypothetical protein